MYVASSNADGNFALVETNPALTPSAVKSSKGNLDRSFKVPALPSHDDDMELELESLSDRLGGAFGAKTTTAMAAQSATNSAIDSTLSAFAPSTDCSSRSPDVPVVAPSRGARSAAAAFRPYSNLFSQLIRSSRLRMR